MIKRGELQKYGISKVPTKSRMPLPWKNQSQDETNQQGTSKSRENLRVISFIHLEEGEKRGIYEEFESRRLERGFEQWLLRGMLTPSSEDNSIKKKF